MTVTPLVSKLHQTHNKKLQYFTVIPIRSILNDKKITIATCNKHNVSSSGFYKSDVMSPGKSQKETGTNAKKKKKKDKVAPSTLKIKTDINKM